jgi:hypothetical protein
MEIKIQKLIEQDDGSAIVLLDMDNDAKEFFIGEGFLAVLKRSLYTSESYISPELVAKAKKKKKK